MSGNNYLGNLADTGQWRLFMEISEDSMSAWLKSVDFQPPQCIAILNEKWDGEFNLLDKIESAVYDNPRLLEDFATHIVVTTPYSLWIPGEFAEEEEFDEKFFTSVYPAKEEDIMRDVDGEEICAYTLVPGLNSFLQRTLPGSKISSHLSVLKSFFPKLSPGVVSGDGYLPSKNRIYVNLRKQWADIFLFENDLFLSGSTHKWETVSDVAYFICLIASVYKIDTKSTELFIFGNENDAVSIYEIIGDFFESTGLIETSVNESMDNSSLCAGVLSGNQYMVRPL